MKSGPSGLERNVFVVVVLKKGRTSERQEIGIKSVRQLIE